MRIAVLAVQGAFAEHMEKLKKLGADCVALRQASDLEQEYDGLILPGGESTVQGKLLRELHMLEPLREKIRQRRSATTGMSISGRFRCVCRETPTEDSWAASIRSRNLRGSAGCP